MKKNSFDLKIRSIQNWAPGDFICYESIRLTETDNSEAFYAVGLVVSSSKEEGIITVLWPDHCIRKFETYNIKRLNPMVISKVDV